MGHPPAPGDADCCGMVFQTVFSNPLVSPDVLGVASGCSVGAVLALLFLPGWTLPLCSFACGILTVAFALFLSSFVRHNRVLGMVLAGIVVGSISSAVLMLLKFLADPEKQLASIEYWLMGSFQNISGWDEVSVVALLVIPAHLLLYGGRFRVKLLSLGDDQGRPGPKLRDSALPGSAPGGHLRHSFGGGGGFGGRSGQLDRAAGPPHPAAFGR